MVLSALMMGAFSYFVDRMNVPAAAARAIAVHAFSTSPAFLFSQQTLSTSPLKTTAVK